MITKLKPGTRCSCGDVMVTHPKNKNILECAHCDTPCDVNDCIVCHRFETGSAHKKLHTWNSMVIYREQNA